MPRWKNEICLYRSVVPVQQRNHVPACSEHHGAVLLLRHSERKVFLMILIPDDPIIASLERTGFPPWLSDDWEDDEEDEDDERDSEVYRSESFDLL